MDLMFPTAARFSNTQWVPVSNTTGARSIFSGAVTSLERAGPRWRIMISTANSTDRISTYAERSILKSVYSALNGQANRIWVADPSYVQRGSFPTSELLSNNTFSNGTTGWASSASITLSAADRMLRAVRATVGATATTLGNSSSVTVVTGAPYVFRAFLWQGLGPYTSGHRLHFGSTFGGAELLLGSTSASYGMFTLSHAPASTPIFVGIRDASTSGQTAGDYVGVHYTSLSRCMLIAGGSQTGRSLNVDGLPTSTSGLLLPGDRVQIGNTLCMVISRLDSNSSGAGYLQLHRAPRATPADNDPVIVHNPMGRFVMTEDAGGWDDRPGQISDFSMTLEEALDS
jgi:hypothetical protein